MATGRTTLRFTRAYVDGYDMSGYTRSFGPLKWTFDEGVDDPISATVKGTSIGQSVIGMGSLNGLFDNTPTSGIHVVMNGAGGKRNVMLPFGIQAAPANNDPVFAGQFLQKDYVGDPAANPVTATIPFENTHALADNLPYSIPWGVLSHAKATRTAANTATGLDQLAATAKGGWFMYQVFSSDGTATLKIQDAATNADGSFADLLSSGSLDFSNPLSGVVALAPGSTVRRYIRWQLALGTATTITFSLAFMRNYN